MRGRGSHGRLTRKSIFEKERDKKGKKGRRKKKKKKEGKKKRQRNSYCRSGRGTANATYKNSPQVTSSNTCDPPTVPLWRCNAKLSLPRTPLFHVKRKRLFSCQCQCYDPPMKGSLYSHLRCCHLRSRYFGGVVMVPFVEFVIICIIIVITVSIIIILIFIKSSYLSS